MQEICDSGAGGQALNHVGDRDTDGIDSAAQDSLDTYDECKPIGGLECQPEDCGFGDIEHASSGKVLGITVAHPGGTLNIEARKGVIIATGGHTGNVNFRRTFDPRLTEEYQQACLPYVFQGAKGELAAMEIGASLWATANQTSESGAAITKTRHIGCRWGYSSLVFQPESKLFPLAKATGLGWETTKEILLLQAGTSGSSTLEIDQCCASFARLQPDTAKKAIHFYRLRERALANG